MDTGYELGSALYGTINAGATVDVYYVRAAQGSAGPYCIIQPQDPGQESYTFSSPSMVDAAYTIKIVSDRDWPTEAHTIYSHIHTLAQDVALSLSNHTSLRCRRVSLLEYQDARRYWHVGGVYEVSVQKTS